MVSQRKEDWKTLSGLDLDLQSTSKTLQEMGADPTVTGDAGTPPYTRGIHTTMYR